MRSSCLAATAYDARSKGLSEYAACSVSTLAKSDSWPRSSGTIGRRALDALVSGNYSIEESSTLNAAIEGSHGNEDHGWAINDVVIRSGVRMIDIELYVDGYYVNTFPGDGIIVATSRGSTAYCMAAGGPILTAGVKGFAIVPISCHSPIRTPMVVAESAKIDLLFKSRYDAGIDSGWHVSPASWRRTMWCECAAERISVA